MQPDPEHHYADAGTSEQQQESGLIATLLNSAPVLLSSYKLQWQTTRDLFRLELERTLKSGLFIILSLMILGCVLLSSWLGLNVGLAYGLLAVDAPLWSVVLAVITLHLCVCVGALRVIKLLTAEIGFKQSLSAFDRVSPQAAQTAKEES